MDTPDEDISAWDAMWARASNRGHLAIRPHSVDLTGIEHGLTLVIGKHQTKLGTVLVLHEAGRSYFSGRGQRGYAPASIKTVLIGPKGSGSHGDLYPYIDLAEVPASTSADEREALHTTLARSL